MQLTEKQKYEIIILREQKNKIDDIAKKMEINRKTVMLWIRNYEINKNVDRKEGAGRKKITSIDDDNIVNLIKENDDLTIKEIKNILEEENNIMISSSTVRRRLLDNNFSYRFPIKKPLLTENHKKKRLEWAKQNIKRNWNKVIFSDECAFKISGFNKKKWIHKDNTVVIRS